MSTIPSKSRLLTLVLGIGIAVAAFNMRAPIQAVGPLLETIRADTGMSTTVAGLLTTLPVVCWGLLSNVAPRVAARFGIDLAIWLSMIGLTVGIVIRLAEPITMLFFGTFVIGASIAMANVLVPSVIKRDFPERTGLMTGIYTMGITIGGAGAAGLMAPIHERGLGWRETMALLAIPGLVAVANQAPRLRMNRAARSGPDRRATTVPRLWRNRLAWSVSLFMGLQSAVFFGMATWAPTVFSDGGMSQQAAGTMWAIGNISGLPAALIVPQVAQRSRDQRPILVVIVTMWAISVAGMMLAPTAAAVLWMVLFGLACGGALALALMLIVLRSPDTRHAASLSGMAQTIGYSIAALSPFLIGALRDITGGWRIPIALLLVTLIPTLTSGWRAAQRGLVEETPPQRVA